MRRSLNVRDLGNQDPRLMDEAKAYGADSFLSKADPDFADLVMAQLRALEG